MRDYKEYLEKQPDGTYALVLRGDLCKESDILIPEGANVYARCNIFGDYKLLPYAVDGDWDILWQRESELRAMVKPMKEYLEPLPNGEYKYHSNASAVGGEWLKIPEGAIQARFYPHDPDELEFENSTFQWWHNENNKWRNYENYSNTLKHSRVVWQRDQDQDEPFLTPECTLNDQYAEIEQVRQHKHYFKDVSGLNEIDVYMVLKLFNVTDPCLQHIAKKALCAGQRGHKDFKKDLQDILDTAKRAVEINN